MKVKVKITPVCVILLLVKVELLVDSLFCSLKSRMLLALIIITMRMNFVQLSIKVLLYFMFVFHVSRFLSDSSR